MLYLQRAIELMRRDEGATAVEYGVMIALIVAVVAGIVAILGPALIPGFQEVVNSI